MADTNWGKISGTTLALGSSILGYQSQIAQAGSYGAQAVAYTMKARSLELGKSSAKLGGKITALNLNTHFNESMANQVVMNAAQGRRGGTVEAIASAAETQYNWDLDYSELSTDYEIHGLEAERFGAIAAAKGAEAMALTAKSQARVNLGMSLLSTAATAGSI